MTKTTRARHMLEFKEEAVGLVKGGARPATVAKNPGLSEQTLHNRIKAIHAMACGSKPAAKPRMRWLTGWCSTIEKACIPPWATPIRWCSKKFGVVRSGHSPGDDAALKLLFLVLNQTEEEWTTLAREWCMAKAQFAVMFGERFTDAMA